MNYTAFCSTSYYFQINLNSYLEIHVKAMHKVFQLILTFNMPTYYISVDHFQLRLE